MSDIYKLQYNGMTLSHPDWNGFLQYENPMVGYPITYLADDHVHVTGATIYTPGDEGITLDSGYDTYYRISGYDVTGGTVENGVLIPTGPCTVKAVEKVNYFTATGGWEKGSNVNAVAKGGYYEGDASIPDKYAIHGGHTGDIPTTWYSNSNRWNVNSEVSSYSITMNPIMGITAARSNNASNTDSRYTAYAYIGSTSTAGASQNNLPMGLTKYNKTFTTNTTGVYYKINGHLHTWTKKGGVYSTAGYVAAQTTGTWTATGIAP